MWYSLLRQSVSLDTCAADQFYITTLVLTREIFPVKQIKHVAIAKTYTSMKARDVKNENRMKSGFFRGNLSPIDIQLLRQSSEIRLQGYLVEESFYLVARKGK